MKHFKLFDSVNEYNAVAIPLLIDLISKFFFIESETKVIFRTMVSKLIPAQGLSQNQIAKMIFKTDLEVAIYM